MGFIRYGIHAPLEAAADELLRRSMAGITSMNAKSDILTPWKQRDRLSKEVFTTDGTPDPAIRRGMYHRAANSRDAHLNSRDGVAPARRTGGSTLADFVEENSSH